MTEDNNMTPEEKVKFEKMRKEYDKKIYEESVNAIKDGGIRASAMASIAKEAGYTDGAKVLNQNVTGDLLKGLGQDNYQNLLRGDPSFEERMGLMSDAYKKNASSIWSAAVISVKTDDLYEIMGVSDEARKVYAGKYIRDLDDKAKEDIVGRFNAYVLKDEIINGFTSDRDGVKKDLEEMLLASQKENSKDNGENYQMAA